MGRTVPDRPYTRVVPVWDFGNYIAPARMIGGSRAASGAGTMITEQGRAAPASARLATSDVVQTFPLRMPVTIGRNGITTDRVESEFLWFGIEGGAEATFTFTLSRDLIS